MSRSTCNILERMLIHTAKNCETRQQVSQIALDQRAASFRPVSRAQLLHHSLPLPHRSTTNRSVAGSSTYRQLSLSLSLSLLGDPALSELTTILFALVSHDADNL